jgi:hypothetical protein
VILETLADGIRASFERRSAELSRQLRLFGTWLRDVSSPPSGVELRVLDGAQYTGIVLVERNVVVAILAFRQGQEPRGSQSFGYPRPSPPSPSRWSPEPRPLEPRGRHEDDEPLWRTDDTAYR